jgi:hypothetical protein
MKNNIIFLSFILILNGCQKPFQNLHFEEEFFIGEDVYAIDTILVFSPDVNFDTTSTNIIDVKSLNLDSGLLSLATSYSEYLTKELNDSLSLNSFIDVINDNPGIISIPPEYEKCLESAPTEIKELRDGIIVDAYDFYKGDEKKLGILGFANITMKEDEKITVVEFSQVGSQICNSNYLKYGIGARLMMRVTSSKRRAKLGTPQQITASVIFGQADVRFSMRTFGISGPGISRLNKVGSVTENTYSSFMSEISNLIIEIYQDNSEYLIKPQPLFLK